MDREHELSTVLADETRYQIYRAIAERPQADVTVNEIAARFGLHPNVARMHLSKLASCGLLTTGSRRRPSGGRPARLYRRSDQAVTLTFPPRRYDLLARLTLEALAACGSSEATREIFFAAGEEEARRGLSEWGRGQPATAAELVDFVTFMAAAHGLAPEIRWRDDQIAADFRNCPFAEASAGHPELVCPLHHAFLAGVLSLATDGLGELVVDDDASMSRGDDHCAVCGHIDLDQWLRAKKR